MENYLYNVELAILHGINKKLKSIEQIDSYVDSIKIIEPTDDEKKEYIKDKELYQDWIRYGVDEWKRCDLIRKVLFYNSLYGIHFVKLCLVKVNCSHCYNVSYSNEFFKEEFISSLNDYEILKGYKTVENDSDNNAFWLFYPEHTLCSEVAKHYLEVYNGNATTSKNDKDIKGIVMMLRVISPYYGRNCHCYSPQISVIEIEEHHKNRNIKDENTFELYPSTHQPSGGSSGYKLFVQLTTKHSLEQLCIDTIRVNYAKEEINKLVTIQSVKEKYDL